MGLQEDRADHISDQDLAPLVESWLVGTGWRLSFPIVLERQFEVDTEASRRRVFRITTWICLTIYVGYLFIYDLLMPQEIWRFVISQLGIATPACLAAVYLTRRPCPVFLREAAFAVVSLVCLVAIAWAYQPSHAPIAANMRYSSVLSMLYCNVIIGVRFPYAVVTSLLMILATYIDCEFSTLSSDFRLHVCTNAGYVAVFTLIGNYRLEREARRNYLFTLRERFRSNELGDANRRLYLVSMLDPLTGLANRRAFEAEFAAAWDAARAEGQPLGVLMIDVDHFKSFNDRYGHPAGDECLRRVAGALHAELRLGQDTLARYGGEEFIAVLPGADLAQCAALGDRMRLAVQRLALPHGVCPKHPVVTVSVGIAATTDAAADVSTELIEAADAALYEAKNAGRNRVGGVPDARGEPVVGNVLPKSHPLAWVEPPLPAGGQRRDIRT